MDVQAAVLGCISPSGKVNENILLLEKYSMQKYSKLE